MKTFLIVLIVAGAIWYGFVIYKHKPLNEVGSKVVMQITSPAFANGGPIPLKYTCAGDNVSPPLRFNVPAGGAVSLALIMDDPDAPNGTYTHWIVYNIDGGTINVPEGSIPGTIATNSSGKRNYTGPCPSSGTHSYHFKLYALNIRLQADSIFDTRELEGTMRGHIVDQAELVGRFKKP